MAVYVIHALETTRYKIGRAEDPEKRLKELQTGSPFPLRVINVIDTCWDKRAERDLHNTFGEYRVCGEWFDLPEDAVNYLTNCEYQDISRLYAASFLLRKDLASIMSKSKVDRLRRELTEVLRGAGIQNRWTAEGNAEQVNAASA